MSPENPYAPPQAVVADEPEQVLPRPRVVTIAVWMLWSEVALSTTSAVRQMMHAPTTIVLLSVLIGAVLLQGLSALLIYKIWKGRNWARITYLVLMLLGILSLIQMVQMAATLPAGVKYMPGIEALFGIVGTILDLVALYLVFVPGRSWFRRRLRQ